MRKRREFLQYAAIGVSGILIDAVLFFVLIDAFNVHPAIATIISTTCGITNNFVWNARITFKARDRLATRFLLFFGVGATGIITSAIVLLLFADIFALNAGWVKVLSVPPIVLGQFWLNKHISFNRRMPSLKDIARFLRNHQYFLVICSIFLVLSLLTVRFLPFTPGTIGGPDEHQHYQKNVQFILQNHRLPISSQDDIDSLSKCRDNDHGKVPCIYSYQFTPQLPYISSVLTAKIGSVFGLSELTGARLASTAWGLLFLVAAYLTCRLFLVKKYALGLTAIIASIPQLIFISSYVSPDAYSLAVAAWVVYTSLRVFVFGGRAWRWTLYVSFGLLFAAKYNYLIVTLVPLALLVRQWLLKRDTKQAVRHGIWLVAAALVISGGWYVRNLVLYHDLTGMNFAIQEMTKFHALGVAWSPFALSSYVEILRFDALSTLFNSFFSQVGYMFVQLDDAYYMLLSLGVVAALVIFWLYSARRGRMAISLAAGFTGLVLAMVAVNAFVYDFQFQGRYMYPALPVMVAATACALAEVAKKRPQLALGMLIAGTCIMGVVLLQTIATMAALMVNFA